MLVGNKSNIIVFIGPMQENYSRTYLCFTVFSPFRAFIALPMAVGGWGLLGCGSGPSWGSGSLVSGLEPL